MVLAVDGSEGDGGGERDGLQRSCGGGFWRGNNGEEEEGGEGRYGTLERMASSMGVCEAIVESCRRAKASAGLRSIKTVQDSTVGRNEMKMAEQVVLLQSCSCSKGIWRSP